MTIQRKMNTYKIARRFKHIILHLQNYMHIHGPIYKYTEQMCMYVYIYICIYSNFNVHIFPCVPKNCGIRTAGIKVPTAYALDLSGWMSLFPFSTPHLHPRWIRFYPLIWASVFIKDLERINTLKKKVTVSLRILHNQTCCLPVAARTARSAGTPFNKYHDGPPIASSGEFQDITSHKCTSKQRLCQKPLLISRDIIFAK